MLAHEWTRCEFPIQGLPHPTAAGEPETAMRLSRMQFIIMSNTARTHFSSWERTFAHCCCAHMSGVPLKPRQANENKTVAQTCPTEAEMVPIMIVNTDGEEDETCCYLAAVAVHPATDVTL